MQFIKNTSSGKANVIGLVIKFLVGLGIIIGIVSSSFIFALAHLSLSEFPPLFVLGVGLGVTRLLSGSLASSIVMHSLWNGLTFFNLFLLRT